MFVKGQKVGIAVYWLTGPTRVTVSRPETPRSYHRLLHCLLLDKRNCWSWWSPTDIQVVTFPISTLDSSGVLRVPLTADFLNIINGVL